MGIKTRVVGAVIAASAAGLAFIQSNEHTVYKAYPDPVAGWHVPTICAGHTAGVRLGDVASPEQCWAMLQFDANAAGRALSNCITVEVTQNQADALIDLAHTTGPAAVCRSSIARKLNQGDVIGAADVFPEFYKAGGKDCRIRANGCYGVVTRRAAERDLFLKGAQ